MFFRFSGKYFYKIDQWFLAIFRQMCYTVQAVISTRLFFWKGEYMSKKTFSAVILAGGSSTRMGGISKQQALLAGIPVAVRSMLAFENCFFCKEILVVSKESECLLYPEYAAKYGIKKFSRAIRGGETRQESAFLGMNGVDPDTAYIAFHDAARCLVTPKEIEAVFLCACRYRCATACTEVTDTVKLVDRHGKTQTEGQPQRAQLRAMQTPQIFYADLYRAAAYTAQRDGFTATDDCSLLEHAGFGTKCVPCSRTNLKITTPEDLVLAEALLRSERD